MDLSVKKHLAAKVANCSPKRIIFDPDRLEEISKAITKADMRGLINDNAIVVKHKRGVSRGRVRLHDIQKKKGRRAGQGRRKGVATSRLPKKEAWMTKIRLQRTFIRELKEKELIENTTFRELYLKSKGGFFRSKNHIKIYLSEHNLFKKPEAKK